MRYWVICKKIGTLPLNNIILFFGKFNTEQLIHLIGEKNEPYIPIEYEDGFVKLELKEDQELVQIIQSVNGLIEIDTMSVSVEDIKKDNGIRYVESDKVNFILKDWTDCYRYSRE